MGKSTLFSVNFFKKFLKSLGVEQVSYKAAIEFTLFIEGKVRDLLEEAAKYMEHAQRKTLFLEDLKIARKRLKM